MKNVLQKIDNYIIKGKLKRKDGLYEKMLHNKWFLIFVSIFAIEQTIEHAIAKYEHHNYFFTGVYISIAILLAYFSFRHIFYKEKIDGFEYKIKFVETILMGIFTALHIIEKWHVYPTWKMIVMPINALLLFTMFLIVCRLHYLKHKGLI
jgi:hypothetical protein